MASIYSIVYSRLAAPVSLKNAHHTNSSQNNIPKGALSTYYACAKHSQAQALKGSVMQSLI